MTNQITIVDSVSAEVAGQDGQLLITGTASLGSYVDTNLIVPPPCPEQQSFPYNSFSILIGGTWVGMLQVEGSIDSGQTYAPYDAQILGLDQLVSQITENCILKGNAAGLTNIRIRAIEWTSGTATVLTELWLNQDLNNVNVINPIQISTPVNVVPTPVTPYTDVIGISATPIQLKSSGGIVTAFDFVNKSNADAYILFFDKLAVNVVLGVTEPLFFVWVPQSGGFDRDLAFPYKFLNGITIAATTEPMGDTAPSEDILVPSIGYL